MANEYTVKTIISTIETPMSVFGSISENRISIGGNFVITNNNHQQWKQALAEFDIILESYGLKIKEAYQ